MSAKYHVNPATGDVGVCTATKRACSYGDDENHFTSAEAARAAYEESSSEAPKKLSKNANPKTNLDELAQKFKELSHGVVRLEDEDWKLKVEGVESYHELLFNAEHDHNLYLVKPLDGEPFSIVDYGIHVVEYDDDLNPTCVLSVPPEKRMPYRHFHNSGTFYEWASENENFDIDKAEELATLMDELD